MSRFWIVESSAPLVAPAHNSRKKSSSVPVPRRSFDDIAGEMIKCGGMRRERMSVQDDVRAALRVIEAAVSICAGVLNTGKDINDVNAKRAMLLETLDVVSGHWEKVKDAVPEKRTDLDSLLASIKRIKRNVGSILPESDVRTLGSQEDDRALFQLYSVDALRVVGSSRDELDAISSQLRALFVRAQQQERTLNLADEILRTGRSVENGAELCGIATRMGFLLQEGGSHIRVCTRTGKLVTVIPKHAKVNGATAHTVLIALREANPSL